MAIMGAVTVVAVLKQLRTAPTHPQKLMKQVGVGERFAYKYIKLLHKNRFIRICKWTRTKGPMQPWYEWNDKDLPDEPRLKPYSMKERSDRRSLKLVMNSTSLTNIKLGR